ncbi:MAG: hypothetical protein PHV42_03930 [Candidatus Pacebacteria bacterium]|nr:hypothetical protein [Candidatus Paceibacterota bacterium]
MGEKEETFGFYQTRRLLWPVSLFIPISGSIGLNNGAYERQICITSDEKKVTEISKAIANSKWKSYHALFQNCFHWRNFILGQAGFSYPTRDWFF